jgi:molybdate transport system substrate-binding protein
MAREPLRIFAAASTIAAVNDAAKLYSKSHEIRVVAVFASSGALARQLAAGAPGHLFLSADPKWMDWAQSQGAINGPSRRVLLGNRLVLAAPKGSGRKFKITKSLDLPALLNGGRLAIADPAHAPLGAHARAALVWMGAWKKVASRALRLADAAQTRVLVERGEAAFGILYQSDVSAQSRLEAAGVFPPESHPSIRYEIALTRAAADNAAARSLLEWLSGAAARGIFARFGFTVK